MWNRPHVGNAVCRSLPEASSSAGVAVRLFVCRAFGPMICRRTFLPSSPSPLHLFRLRRLVASSSPSSSLLSDTSVSLRKHRPAAALTQKAALELSKKRWLDALAPVAESEDELPSIPFPSVEHHSHSSAFVLGIDPDVSGAMAVITCDDLSTVEVFDVPSVNVVVGSQNRRRHDPRTIAHLLKKLDAPPGSVAYVEQSMPLPKDGKQGWWGSGFGFGIWIGSLVASGFTVVPVPPSVWKHAMELSGTKDDSRECASLLFPSLSSQLQRKKDHGRAEALLIAAYGKGISPPTKEVKCTIAQDQLVIF